MTFEVAKASHAFEVRYRNGNVAAFWILYALLGIAAVASFVLDRRRT